MGERDQTIAVRPVAGGADPGSSLTRPGTRAAGANNPAFDRLAMSLPLGGLLVLLLLYPMTLLVLQSLRPADGPGISSYLLLFTERPYRLALFHSVILSAIVAFVSTLICLAPAWLFANEKFAGKNLVRAFFTLPMSFSGIIVGFLAVIMVGRIGAVPQLFERLTGNAYTAGWAYQLSGLVLAYLYFEIPRATLTLESALKKFDPHLAVAARSLGADAWQRFRFVVLPLIWRPLVSTFAVTFTVSLGSFGVALVLSKRFSVLPLEIYQQITGFGTPSLMAAMAVTLIAIALTINLLVRQIGAGETARTA